MIDIFDQILPPTHAALQVTRHAAWTLVTHRLTGPVTFWLFSLLVLYAVSQLGSQCVETKSKLTPSQTCGIHAYSIPVFNVLALSADTSTLTIDVTPPKVTDARPNETNPCQSLYYDVRMRAVNTLIIGGSVWFASTHTARSNTLVLTSMHTTCFPSRMSPTMDWIESQNKGALVLAFKDTLIPASGKLNINGDP